MKNVGAYKTYKKTWKMQTLAPHVCSEALVNCSGNTLGARFAQLGEDTLIDANLEVAMQHRVPSFHQAQSCMAPHGPADKRLC